MTTALLYPGRRRRRKQFAGARGVKWVQVAPRRDPDHASWGKCEPSFESQITCIVAFKWLRGFRDSLWPPVWHLFAIKWSADPWAGRTFH